MLDDTVTTTDLPHGQAVPGGLPATTVLVLDEDPGGAPVRDVIDALEAAGMRVDVHAPSHRSEGGLLPLEAVRYDIVVRRPEAPAGSSSSAPKQDVEIGRLRIDTQRRMVLVDGASVRMSAREFPLLHYLASYPDVVFSREALLRAVWGSSWRTEGSVTEYVRRVRMLLAPSGIGECIVTRKGFGYAFDPDAVQ
ncbi:MAG: winged helix-turn-helix domain-containing protein [Actinomycetota bacterium]